MYSRVASIKGEAKNWILEADRSISSDFRLCRLMEELLGIRQDSDSLGGKAKTRRTVYGVAEDGKENYEADFKVGFLIYCISSVTWTLLKAGE